MKFTDKLRKRLADYQFESGDKLRDIDRELDIGYQTLSDFKRAETEGNGKTINEIDNFLTERGY
jgi:transposase